MSTSRSIGLLVVGLTGCSGAPSWTACDNAECRSEAIESAYTKNPSQVLDDLGAMTDEIEQLSLIDQLAHAFPEQKDTICAVAPPGSQAQDRCNRMELRPHLYTQQKLHYSDDRLGTRQAPGPAESVPMRSDLPLSWNATDLDKEAVRGDCGENNTCLSDRARGLAEQGQAEDAGKACAVAWPDGSSAREECYFRVAETLAKVGGMTLVKDALALCHAAPNIGRNCTQHVLIEAIPDPPPADAPDTRSVEEGLAAAKFFTETFVEPQRTFYTSYFWAVWTRDAYVKADAITGHLLAALPPEAAPHVRAAAAWKYAQSSPESFVDLDRVAGYLKARLAVTGPLLAPATEVKTDTPRIEGAQPGAFWTSDKDELERQIPSVIFIGSGRRATSPNVDDDLRIAVLEAAARMSPPPDQRFLLSIIQSKHADLVRWTAARLFATLWSPAVKQIGLSDANPLIQDGLNYSRTGGSNGQ